ncbi:putative mitochondrial protein [Cucumis melo var. makuwa]|uniref:Putative mitochondrial protein n=1 Tax=Cucumis melo var. makuwa TaxID=1194695 RepID=A0A5D3BYQ7_CUCMM|nr:putative mitochondrial protein [Cucumis melo var. makuwa]
MNKYKFRAIKEWRAPTSVTELLPFLGLANYYHRFIEGFLRRDALLTELLKKGTTWRWPVECQTTFDELKVTMTRGLILGLVDVSKPFLVETDASDFVFGGVLTQEGHPIAYKSHKLNNVERRYTVSKKEMLVVESVSLDFITHLSKMGDLEARLVIIDRFSKYDTFIPTTNLSSAELTPYFFFKHVVNLSRVSMSIVSNQDGRFMGTFWTELFTFLGRSLNISLSSYPKTDGQKK